MPTDPSPPWRLAGVIGRPVGHSRSPKVHRHWLARHGVKGDYVALEVAEGDLADVLRLLPKAGFVGVNVTIPHKVAALALAHEATDRARRAGAANLLTFEGGRVHADVTDGEGFLAALAQGAPGWEAGAGEAVVLGAGGAARSVVAALLDAGAPRVLVANRTPAHAEALAAEMGTRVEPRPWAEAGDLLGVAATVVNATSLGMRGAAPFDVAVGALRPGQVVCDLVYEPLETPLLAAARAAGATPVDGLGMLLHQAVPAFERWFGMRPAVDEALRAAVLG